VLFAAFKSLSQQFLVISALIFFCALVTWFLDGKGAAISLLQTAIVGMKGPWVWTFGFGLAFLISSTGRGLPNDLIRVLEPNEIVAAATARIERSTHHRYAYRYTAPITLVGIVLTFAYGVPSRGFAYYALFLGVCATYYIAAFILFHFVQITLAFHSLFESMETVAFRNLLK
jgi:hypothetical protein